MEDIPVLAQWLGGYDATQLKSTVSKILFTSWKKHAEVILLTKVGYQGQVLVYLGYLIPLYTMYNIFKKFYGQLYIKPI